MPSVVTKADSGLNLLDQIEITGRQIEEKLSAELSEFGHQVVVIEGEKIEEMGFLDLNDALPALVPGLFISNKGRGDYALYNMNGNDNVVWLLDGIRLNNRLYGRAYMDNLGVHNIERIEVLYGGESLFYGSYATSGVINVITKKPTEELTGQFGVSFGSRQFVGTHGYVSNGVNGWRFLASASFEEFKGYLQFREDQYLSTNHPERKRRGYDRSNIAFKVSKDFGSEANKRLNISLQKNSGDYEYAYINFLNGLNERDEYVATFKWDHDVTPNYSYYVKAYYHDWRTHWSQKYLDGKPRYNRNLWYFDDMGLNILNSYKFDSGDEILFGVDYQSYTGQDTVLIIPKFRENHYAGFFQVRPHFNFFEEWKLALGLRYTDFGNGDVTVWNVSSRMPLVKDKLFFRANVGTTFKLPTAEQLHANDNSEVGNPNLKAEESLSLNLGLEYASDFLNLEASYFSQDLKNKIQYDSGNSFENSQSKTKINGYTLTARLTPTENFSIFGSYTFQRAKQKDQKFLRGNVPDNFASVGLDYRHDFGSLELGGGLSGKYFGETPYRDNVRIFYGKVWTADLSLYAKFGEHHRVSLYVNNITDKDYTTTTGRVRLNSSSPWIWVETLSPPLTATLSYTYTF